MIREREPMDTGSELPPNPEAPQQRKPRVLIVEDDPAVEMLLRATLEGVVEGAIRSYKRAGDVEKMLQEQPDASLDWVITDWGLVDDDDAGSRVVRAIGEKYPEAEITILTGSPDKPNNTYSPTEKETRRIEVIGKPFNPLKFMQKVQQISQRINASPPTK